ncbi:hypothetical protein RJ639_015272 [Escallonia herrerae]|uniref:Uncharacterized protein n=1 Tax=Escallonia herrerae TaxID=1293975 RepID=A0AA88VLA9_9ASTE|nr:hypothetical protein RJ639_015272 [Escallonia herrerae]
MYAFLQLFTDYEDLEKSLGRAADQQKQLNPAFRQGDIQVAVLEDIIKGLKDFKERKDTKVGKRDRPELSQSHTAQSDGKRKHTSSSITVGQRDQGQRQGLAQGSDLLSEVQQATSRSELH